MCVHGCMCMGVCAWVCVHGRVCMGVCAWGCVHGGVSMGVCACVENKDSSAVISLCPHCESRDQTRVFSLWDECFHPLSHPAGPISTFIYVLIKVNSWLQPSINSGSDPHPWPPQLSSSPRISLLFVCDFSFKSCRVVLLLFVCLFFIFQHMKEINKLPRVKSMLSARWLHDSLFKNSDVQAQERGLGAIPCCRIFTKIRAVTPWDCGPTELTMSPLHCDWN